jgi:hypothetical protein
MSCEAKSCEAGQHEHPCGGFGDGAGRTDVRDAGTQENLIGLSVRRGRINRDERIQMAELESPASAMISVVRVTVIGSPIDAKTSVLPTPVSGELPVEQPLPRLAKQVFQKTRNH